MDGFSWKTVGAGIAAAIHLVLHVGRQADGTRCITDVAYVETAGDGWALRPI